MNHAAFLIIQKGTPYEVGTILPLQINKNLIGRMTASFIPEISFTNLLISRSHCVIEFRNGGWVLSELGSRHGTLINYKKVATLSDVSLHDGDRISLAGDVAIFRFVLPQMSENTIDPSIVQFQSEKERATLLDSSFLVNMDKMQLVINGQEVYLSVKEWELFALLYQNRDKVISHATIMNEVWKERALENNVLDVSTEEINILIFRLRRKLGTYSSILKTIRGRGCILELQ